MAFAYHLTKRFSRLKMVLLNDCMIIYIFVVHSVLLVIQLAKWDCTVCGWSYDEEVEGAPFEELPEDWICPSCGVDKSYFEKEQ